MGTHRTPALKPKQAGLRTSTEYEGPSLREKLAALVEAHPEVGGRASPAAMRTSFEDNPHMRPTSAQKSFMRTPGERIKTSAKVLARKVKGGIKKAVGAVKKAVGLGDWTRYEGTPLAEQAQYLQQFVESMPASEKKKTGTSMYRSTEDPAREGGQGSQGTGNLPGSGVRRRKDPAAALKKSRTGGTLLRTFRGGAVADKTEHEGPSLREKLEKVRRGVRAGATGSVTGGYLSVAGEKGTGRKVVGSWAQAKHRKPGSKVDAPITYAAKDHTEYEGPSLAETKDWIQGAVNPKHKGYCTPMTKKTCTPARKALAKRFKKAGRREGTKKGGKTGWKGKV